MSTLPPDVPAAGRPSFFQSSLITFGATVLAAALGLVNVFIVARALGPSGRGDVTFLMAIGFLTSQAATLGVDQAIVNFAGREPALRRPLAGTAVALAAIFGLAGAGLVTLLVTLVPGAGGDADRGLLDLVLLAMPLLVLRVYMTSLTAAFYGFSTMNTANLLPPAANVIGNAAVVALGTLTVGIAISIWLVGQVASLLLLGWFVLARLGGIGAPSLGLARRACGFGIKAHGGRLMLLGNYRLDQWLLGALAGSRELGLYSVAVSWSETLFYLPNAVMSVQRPDLVRATSEGAARQVSVVFRISMLVTLVMAAGLFALAPVLCTTIFGAEFAGSVDDLRILALGAFGIGALKILGDALTAQRRPLLETAALGVAFVSILALDVLLIPAHGGLGAALASFVAYSAGGAVVIVIFCRTLGASLRDLTPRLGDVSYLVRRVRAELNCRRPRT